MTVSKVLVIPSWYPSPEFPTAGVFIKEQVRALADGGLDVAVLYVRLSTGTVGPVVTQESGIHVVRTELGPARTATSVIGRARAIVTNLMFRIGFLLRLSVAGLECYEELCSEWGTPDIVHVQALYPAAAIARRIKRRYGIPYVVTEHSEEYLAQSERRLVKYPAVVRILLRPLAHGASRTIAVSDFLADRLSQLDLAVDPVVIPNVVPVFGPWPVLSAPRKRIAHVSVMGPAKNLEGLLAAVDELRGRRSDFILTLVGDGEMREELQRIASERCLDTYVEFVGRKDSEGVREVLRESAFVVVSSTHETFSVSAAEALMAGRPVVSTRCGGPEGFISPEVGLLVDVGSVSALVEGLDRMLDEHARFDPEALHRYARERFSPDVVARRILDVYEEAIDVQGPEVLDSYPRF